MAAKPRIALVGAGGMGSNHARIVSASSAAELAVVVDPDLERARRLADTYGTDASADLADAVKCDAVVVASPTETHVPIAMDVVADGVPVLVEKPLDATADGARAIIAASERRGVPLTCGFVERFNPVLATARGLLTEPPIHVVALRHSPPTPNSQVSVIWELLVHDIDIAVQLTGGDQVVRVRGNTAVPRGWASVEVADASMQFAGGTIATLSASRMSQRKVRLVHIEAADRLIELDLMRQDITVYRNVQEVSEIVGSSVTYRANTVIDLPFVRHAGEPLALELQHFLDLVEGRADADAERATLLQPHEIAARLEDDMRARDSRAASDVDRPTPD